MKELSKCSVCKRKNSEYSLFSSKGLVFCNECLENRSLEIKEENENENRN